MTLKQKIKLAFLSAQLNRLAKKKARGLIRCMRRYGLRTFQGKHATCSCFNSRCLTYSLSDAPEPKSIDTQWLTKVPTENSRLFLERLDLIRYDLEQATSEVVAARQAEFNRTERKIEEIKSILQQSADKPIQIQPHHHLLRPSEEAQTLTPME